MQRITKNNTRCLFGLLFSASLILILTNCNSKTISEVDDKQSSIRYLDPLFPEVEKESGVIYKNTQDEDGQPLALAMDIYQPRGDTLNNRPVIFFFHSGGFSSGNRNSFTARVICSQVAQRGYVAASVSYRLKRNPNANTRTFTDAMEDAVDAIVWLKESAEQYRIDPNRIAVWGASAGSWLAVNLAYSHFGNEQIPTSNYFGLVAMAGYGLVNTTPHPNDAPALLIHGSEDRTRTSGEQLKEILDEIGIKNTIYVIEGVGHNLNGYLDICTQVGIPTLYHYLTGNEVDSLIPTKNEALLKAVLDRINDGVDLMASQVDCTIDGYKSEWLDLEWHLFMDLKDLGASLPDPNDFAASGVVGWNPNTPSVLYGCIEITDNILSTNAPENNIYNLMNDNVEILIDFSNESLLLDPVRWWIRVDGSEYSTPSNTKTLSYAVSRTDHTSIVEFALDMSKMKAEGIAGENQENLYPEQVFGYKVNSDAVIGISLIADDAENGTLEHQIGITPGASWERRHFLNLRYMD